MTDKGDPVKSAKLMYKLARMEEVAARENLRLLRLCVDVAAKRVLVAENATRQALIYLDRVKNGSA